MGQPTNSPTLAATTTPAPLMSAAEFAQGHGGDYMELVKGQVRELPMPFPKHGRICFLMGRFVDEHAEKHNLGRVVSNDSFVKTHSNPDTVRGADVAYYSYTRVPAGPLPRRYLDVPPDLVFEVR